MRDGNTHLDAHVFVCTNKKDPGKECCADKGGKELRDKLKELMSKQNLGGKKVRINASGCLGHCEEGISVAIYPQDKWIFEAKPDDAEAIAQDILKALRI